MKKYNELEREQRLILYNQYKAEYEKYLQNSLSLDLSRGKPNSEQIDISNGLIESPLTKEDYMLINQDLRNYGMLEGVPQLRELFADLLGLEKENIILGGNSSLQLMYDTLVRCVLFGNVDSVKPWGKEEKLKWICVVPGYDRHFRITETLGFEMINVEMTPTGPDMDKVEELVKDPAVKGIWCIPKYSNPTGNTYSDETVRRLAAMKCGAPDFRIFWDNAYAVHDIYGEGDKLLDIFAECKKHGNVNRVYYFTSTSKITFPGAGVSLFSASPANIKEAKKYIGVQTIGFDKLNQLRHYVFLKNSENVKEHMKKHAQFIRRKFDIVLEKFKELKDLGIVNYTEPRGGYFISLDILATSAKKVWDMMKMAGVTLTPACATFPYGIDKNDRNIRIAPTYPSDGELKMATEILVLCIKICTLEELI